MLLTRCPQLPTSGTGSTAPPDAPDGWASGLPLALGGKHSGVSPSGPEQSLPERHPPPGPPSLCLTTATLEAVTIPSAPVTEGLSQGRKPAPHQPVVDTVREKKSTD